MSEQEKPSYLDENLSEQEKHGGHSRIPQPEQEGSGHGQGEEEKQPMRPDRQDDSGDGDRRS